MFSIFVVILVNILFVFVFVKIICVGVVMVMAKAMTIFCFGESSYLHVVHQFFWLSHCSLFSWLSLLSHCVAHHLFSCSYQINLAKPKPSPSMNKHFLSCKISLVERSYLRKLFGKTCFGVISIKKNGVGSGGKNLRWIANVDWLNPFDSNCCNNWTHFRVNNLFQLELSTS